MATEITQGELRNNSGKIVRQLADGEAFVVTRDGAPAAELSPLGRHRFVSARVAIAAFQGATWVDLERLHAELDRAARQDITPHG